MRINELHAYDDRVLNPKDIQIHTFNEYRFRKFVINIAMINGQIGSFYTLIVLMAHLYPEEFSKERVEALKRLTYKVYIAYQEEPPLRHLVAMLKNNGMRPQQIADLLNIKRQNVYYYSRIAEEQETPLQCMLTYGEYDLMMDFLDAWDKTTALGVLP